MNTNETKTTNETNTVRAAKLKIQKISNEKDFSSWADSENWEDEQDNEH